MKGPLLSLAFATIAFAGSSVYLWTQLQAERELVARTSEVTRQLNERVAELEKERGNAEHRRLSAAASMLTPSQAADKPSASPLPADFDAEDIENRRNVSAAFDGARSGLSAAHQKMMRGQFRANTRRMFAELGAELGLSQDEEEKLLDLISDQQLAGVLPPGDGSQITDYKAYWEQEQREHHAQIVDLIGAERAEALRRYQDSLPARIEADAIAMQLEGSDVPLRDDQRKRLVAALYEERARVPMPEVQSIPDQEKSARAIFAWQDDFEERVNAQARNILNPAQYAAYSDYQRWQKEMREQFAEARANGAGGADTLFVVGAPAAVAAPTISIRAPVPETSSLENAGKTK